ncbi:MAG: hypothetical protein WD467_02355 [Candidatus Saccharimonadales bacterium]
MDERLISNPNLAYEMALAEAPFRELARIAISDAERASDTVAAEWAQPKLKVAEREDLVIFGKRRGYGHNMAGRVWNCIRRAHVSGYVQLDFETKPPEEARGVSARYRHLSGLHLESLYRTMEGICSKLEQDVSLRPVDLLGHGAGTKTVQFLAEFAVANKPDWAEIDQEGYSDFPPLPASTAAQDGSSGSLSGFN